MLDPNANLARIDDTVRGALHLWGFTQRATATRINVSENVTYRIQDGPYRTILKGHRPGYHAERAIECELAWIDALRAQSTVKTAATRSGRDGARIQQAAFPDSTTRFLTLFEYIDGKAPSEDGDLSNTFCKIGAIAARTHLHSMNWNLPRPFEQLVRDLSTVSGSTAHWDERHDAPNVTPEIRKVLEQVKLMLSARLSTFGKQPDNYGLIHANMPLPNLIQTPSGIALTDFDDCGSGWHL